MAGERKREREGGEREREVTIGLLLGNRKPQRV